MDPAQVFALLTAIIFNGIALGYLAMIEIRAHRRLREEQHRELLLVLFRTSKAQVRALEAQSHPKALPPGPEITEETEESSND